MNSSTLSLAQADLPATIMRLPSADAPPVAQGRMAGRHPKNVVSMRKARHENSAYVRKLQLQAQFDLISRAYSESVDRFVSANRAKAECEQRLCEAEAVCRDLQARKKALAAELASCRA